MHFSLSSGTLIVNQVLMSPLWYFIAVWVGSRQLLKKVEALFLNHL